MADRWKRLCSSLKRHRPSFDFRKPTTLTTGEGRELAAVWLLT
jgi:hypothetical protein